MASTLWAAGGAARLDHADHEVVGHEPPLVHKGLGAQARVAVRGHLLAQQVARRHVHQPKLPLRRARSGPRSRAPAWWWSRATPAPAAGETAAPQRRPGRARAVGAAPGALRGAVRRSAPKHDRRHARSGLVRSWRGAHTAGRQTSLQGQEKPQRCCAGAWREAGAHREHRCLPPVTHTSWPTFLLLDRARHSHLREHLLDDALALRALASGRRAGYHHVQRRASSLRRSVPLWRNLRRVPQALSRQRPASVQQAVRRRRTARGAPRPLRRSRAAAARCSRLSCSAVRPGLQGWSRLSCKAKEAAELGPAYC